MTCENVCWARLTEGGRCFVQGTGTNGSRKYLACSHPDASSQACPVMTAREEGHRVLERVLDSVVDYRSVVGAEVISILK